MDFPRMLYRKGSMLKLDTGTFDYVVVNSESEQSEHLASGWFMDQFQALGDGNGEQETQQEAGEGREEVLNDSAPPTRAELEAKAKELGIEFDGRTKDKGLAAKIEAALKA